MTTHEFDVVVGAVGMFGNPAWPDIPGLDEFAGTIFHSARWNHDHDLTGERVAVIGSAASAVQFVPAIAPVVGQLHVFQRTPNWVLPKVDEPYTPEELERFRTDPDALLEERRAVWERVEGVITFSDPDVVAAAQELARQNIARRRGPGGAGQAHPRLPARVQAPARVTTAGTRRSTGPTSSSSPT